MRRAAHGVASRRVAAVCPVDHAIAEIEFKVNRLRQTVEEHLDVGATGGLFALRYLEVRAED
jgi:hypothetical protein